MSPNWVTSFPILKAIEESQQSLFQTSASEISLAEGHKMYHEGGRCDDYLMVLNGVMRVCLLSESGREIILYRVRPGQTCFLTTSCLLTSESYPAEGIVEEPISAILVPASLFNQLMTESMVFRNFVFSACGSRISKLMRLVETVAFERIDIRLARFLNSKTSASGVLLTTHQKIAAELGTAREVVSRQLKMFEKKGWITLKRNTISITDTQALLNLETSTELL